MKNNKFSKITLLVISLALVFGSIVPMTVSAETTAAEATKPEIISQNVSYGTNLAVKLAVDASTAAAPIKLYRFDTEPAVGETGTLVAESNEFVVAGDNNNLTKDSYVIQAPGVAASAIAHYYYYQVEDANGNKSDIFRYSVAEYLYERLATSGISDTQKTLYNATIAYGDAAQVHFASADPRVSTLNLVTVDGGVVDGYAQGLYATGATVTPSGAGVTEWTVTTYKADGTHVTKYITGTENFTVAGRTEVVAGHVISYRAGIDNFENLDLGTKPTYASLGNSAVGTIIEDSVYGKTSKVLKLSLSASNHFVRFNKNNTTVAASEATAFEASFDFKGALADGTAKSLKIYLDNSSRTAIYTLYFNSDGVLKFMNTTDTSEGWHNAKVDTTEYNNVCFRVMPDEAGSANFKLHIYVNGAEVFVTDYEALSLTSLSEVTYFRIQAGNLGDVYLDNLYVGYVKD